MRPCGVEVPAEPLAVELRVEQREEPVLTLHLAFVLNSVPPALINLYFDRTIRTRGLVAIGIVPAVAVDANGVC